MPREAMRPMAEAGVGPPKSKSHAQGAGMDRGEKRPNPARDGGPPPQSAGRRKSASGAFSQTGRRRGFGAASEPSLLVFVKTVHP